MCDAYYHGVIDVYKEQLEAERKLLCKLMSKVIDKLDDI